MWAPGRWWWRTRWLRNLWRARLLAVAIGIASAMALAEVALRMPWVPLPGGLRTALFQCYSSEYQDENIAFTSTRLDINLPKPRFDRSCDWGYYRWQHHGDAYGYRNPVSWSQADVVLLGDSTTYGHGVEETQTFAHYLREDLGRAVVNLGWTGDSPVQYLARLRNYALPLRPRVVFVFFFTNDFNDILAYRDPSAIRRFVATGEAPEAGVFSRDELSTDFVPAPQTLSSEIEEHLLTVRSIRFFARRGPETVWSLTISEPVPPLEEDVPLEKGERLALDYLRAATALMARSARDAGVRLVFSVIPGPGTGRLGQLVRHHVYLAAKAAGLPFLDLVGEFAVDGRLEFGDSFLRGDGHLAEAGHRHVARAVSDFIRRERLLETP